MKTTSACILSISLYLLLNDCVFATSNGPETNPIFAAGDYSSKIKSVENGSLFYVAIPDDLEQAPFKVLHVFGNAKERGYAQGQLLATD